MVMVVVWVVIHIVISQKFLCFSIDDLKNIRLQLDPTSETGLKLLFNLSNINVRMQKLLPTP